MMKLTVKAYAKLNLTLDIQGMLPNGYHSIESVFQSISLHDILTIESGVGDISVSCSNENVPTNQDNICYKAVELFLKRAGIRDGVAIHIEKHIPEAAGLGGGSADAAATLVGLNEIYRHILSDADINELAVLLGADVPFCTLGGAYLATGMGEILQPLKSCPDCDIVLVKQGTKPSTAEMYRSFDKNGVPCHPDTAAEIYALQEGSLENVAKYVLNCFAPIWGAEISDIKFRLINCGALTAELTGSGPTVFGIFKKGTGASAMETLRKLYPKVYLCHPEKVGLEIISKN